VSPGAGLGAVENINMSCSCWNSNLGCPANRSVITPAALNEVRYNDDECIATKGVGHPVTGGHKYRKYETVMYGYDCRSTRNKKTLCWRGPTAIYQTDKTQLQRYMKRSAYTGRPTSFHISRREAPPSSNTVHV
jgi:hypothetical protein